MRIAGVLAATASVMVWAGGPAAAGGLVEEIRLGVLDHDIDVINDGAGGKEGGFNLSPEIVFATPAFLEWAGSPEPYVHFSWNSDGGTNFGGFGLNWDADFNKTFFGEFALGYDIHDGVVDLNPDPSNPDRIRLAATRAIMGSRDVFRIALGAGVHLNERWDAAVVLEHYSHGQILGDGKNEGLDNFGVRLSYKLGP